MNDQIVCPSHLVGETLESLQLAGQRRCEGIVFWLGRRQRGAQCNVEEIYIPEHESAKDFFRISPRAMIDFMNVVSRKRISLLAQVHSHPGPAFHSTADDRWAVVRHEGGLSLVVPDFASQTTIDNFADLAAVYRLSATDQWEPVDIALEPQVLRIL